MQPNLKPLSTRCRTCGTTQASFICSLCKNWKVAANDSVTDEHARQVEQLVELIEGRTEDQRLDDPRHGQAKFINRRPAR